MTKIVIHPRFADGVKGHDVCQLGDHVGHTSWPEAAFRERAAAKARLDPAVRQVVEAAERAFVAYREHSESAQGVALDGAMELLMSEVDALLGIGDDSEP